MKEHKKKKQPTNVLLVRHAQNDWVKSGRLAGRTPGVHLNQTGRDQAAALAHRLSAKPLHAVYASPLERAQETAAPIAVLQGLEVRPAPGIGEVDFGKWTGKKIKKLAKKPEWFRVQVRPSAMQFPAGESFRAMQYRAVEAVETLAAGHPQQTIVLVSHADVIKALAAHYLGLHLDQFQRLVISPASITTLTFTPMGGLVLTLNDTAHLEMLDEDE